MTTQHSHPAKLTETQRTIVVAAILRSDASVILPPHLKGVAVRKLGQALLDKGLVREIRAKGEQPVWRKQDGTGCGFALVLTKAGRAPGAEPSAGDQQQTLGISADSDAAVSKAATPTVPRLGSKLAAVIALLDRAQGTSVSEMMAATGWLPHTTRRRSPACESAATLSRARLRMAARCTASPRLRLPRPDPGGPEGEDNRAGPVPCAAIWLSVRGGRGSLA